MKKRIGKKIYNFLLFLDSSQATVLVFTELFLGSIVSIFSFILFSKLSKEVIEKDKFNFDTIIINFVYQLRTPLLTKIMVFLSFIGSDLIVFLAFIIIILLIKKKYKNETVLFSFILAMGFIINILLKFLIRRPRPDIAPLVLETSYSFPSGHSMNSFVFYITLSYFIFRFTRNKKLGMSISLFCLFLIFLIGLSRVYLGVHYPSDVLAGFIGGAWWFVTALLIEKTIIFYKLFKISKKASFVNS